MNKDVILEVGQDTSLWSGVTVISQSEALRDQYNSCLPVQCPSQLCQKTPANYQLDIPKPQTLSICLLVMVLQVHLYSCLWYIATYYLAIQNTTQNRLSNGTRTALKLHIPVLSAAPSPDPDPDQELTFLGVISMRRISSVVSQS